jgi:hypothetical protein
MRQPLQATSVSRAGFAGKPDVESAFHGMPGYTQGEIWIPVRKKV